MNCIFDFYIIFTFSSVYNSFYPVFVFLSFILITVNYF